MDSSANPWGFGADLRHATTRVRIPRLAPNGPVSVTLVVSAPEYAPVVAESTVPVGLVESRVDVILVRADDEGRSGLVELTVPVELGIAGHATPWSLEVKTRDEPRLRVEIFDTTRWSGAGRIDARLPPGDWTLRLLSPQRDSVQFQADVTVYAGVTTRVRMKE